MGCRRVSGATLCKRKGRRTRAGVGRTQCRAREREPRRTAEGDSCHAGWSVIRSHHGRPRRAHGSPLTYRQVARAGTCVSRTSHTAPGCYPQGPPHPSDGTDPERRTGRPVRPEPALRVWLPPAPGLGLALPPGVTRLPPSFRGDGDRQQLRCSSLYLFRVSLLPTVGKLAPSPFPPRWMFQPQSTLSLEPVSPSCAFPRC